MLARGLQAPARGDAATRAAGFAALARAVAAITATHSSAELALLRAELLELVRERVDAAASVVAPPDALVSMIRAPAASRRT